MPRTNVSEKTVTPPPTVRWEVWAVGLVAALGFWLIDPTWPWAMAAAVITVLHDETSMPLAITLMGLAGSAVVVLWFVGRCERKSI